MSARLCKEDAIALGRCALGRGVMLLDCELGWLYDLATLAPDGNAIEAGVFCGGSLVCWASARIGRGAIYGTDIKLRPELCATVAASGYPITLLGGNSWQAPDKIAGDFAFAFIDADHSDAGIPYDIAAYTPRIMPGGVIVFHDYDVWKPTVTVKRHVDAWQSRMAWEVLGQVRSAIAFRRPEE